MKNLKKISRERMKQMIGGAGIYDLEESTDSVGAYWCHFHYTGTLWGDNMKITSTHNGGCERNATNCYKYFQTSPC